MIEPNDAAFNQFPTDFFGYIHRHTGHMIKFIYTALGQFILTV